MPNKNGIRLSVLGVQNSETNYSLFLHYNCDVMLWRETYDFHGYACAIAETCLEDDPILAGADILLPM